MAKATGLETTGGLVVDPIVGTDGTTRYKRGLVSRSAGLDHNVMDQAVATHADDAAFTPATDGVVVIGGFADETSPDSVNEGDAGAFRMTLARNLHVVNVADTATLSQVNSSASSVTILAANANRIGALVFNTDANNLYLAFTSSAATTSAFTVKIAAGGYYEFPAPVYRGQVTGIWDVDGSGAAVVTELT